MTIVWKHKPLAGSSPKPWEERRLGECAFPLESRSGVKSCCLPCGDGTYCAEHRKVMYGQGAKA